MPVERNVWIAVLITAAGAAFWAGIEFQKAVYLDRCLDLGGGRNPGNHPVCVIEREAAPLQLGPIAITAQDVVGGKIRTDLDDQLLVELRLSPQVAAALTEFTRSSVDGTLEIRVDGRLVRSVNVAEGIEGDRFILALSSADAARLAQSLGLEGL